MKLASRWEFPRLIQNLSLQGIGVEVGAGDGNFSDFLIREGNFSLFYSIDPWEVVIPDVRVGDRTHENPEMWRVEESARKRLAPWENRSVILKERSVPASRLFPDEFLDFVYIDGDHRLESVQADLEAWWPKIKANGVLAGDDYEDGEHQFEGMELICLFGVKTAVNSFANSRNLTLYTTGEALKPQWNWQNWYFIKPGPGL